MTKRMEDMSLKELKAQFEEKPIFRMTRRKRNLVLLTLRVSPDVKRRLNDEARRRGVSGYTAMARVLIEKGLRSPGEGDEVVRKIACATADAVVDRLKKRKAV